MKLKLGDHLVSPRTLYSHHGIYIGRGKVIHYAGLADGLSAGPIEIASLEAFSHGKPVEVRKYANSLYKGRDVIARARTRLGENAYDVHANNCEHFCSWAILGSAECDQVELAEDIVGTIFPAAVAATRVRKHIVQEHKSNVARPALETAAQVATLAVFPVATPIVVGYKLLKWMFR